MGRESGRRDLAEPDTGSSGRGRITNVPYDRAAEVHVAFDLGVSDATTLVFFQLCGQEIHWIDCLSDTGRGLDYYVKKVREKPYAYGKFYFPHDIKVRELSTGISRIETFAQF